MKKKSVAAIYFTSFVQGLALVVFPSASKLFTAPEVFNLSHAEYGSLFIPQVVMSIFASLSGAKLAAMGKSKQIYLVGLIANLLSMMLLTLSTLTIGYKLTAFSTLIGATALSGLGFGLTIPCLNTFATALFPRTIDTALLILNGFLGIGMTSAPILLALFSKFDIWWGFPLILMLLFLSLVLSSIPLEFKNGSKAPLVSFKLTKIPVQFWMLAIFALLYGIVETINGNWATIYMTQTLKSSPQLASVTLAIFWGMLTIGRLFFGIFTTFIPPRLTYNLFPFIIATAFLLLSLISAQDINIGMIAFALAGIGCSTLLPLTISFAANNFPKIRSSVAALLIAFYTIGLGIAAFGIGLLHEVGDFSLQKIFFFVSFIAIVMGCLSFTILKEDFSDQRE